MSEVKVLPVPEGSIIWLHDIDFPPGDVDEIEELALSLLKACGHDRFVVLHTSGGGIVDVVGPDELVARVRVALEPDAPASGARWVEDEDGASIVESG